MARSATVRGATGDWCQKQRDEASAIVENLEPPPSGYGDAFGEAVLARLTELVGVDEGDA